MTMEPLIIAGRQFRSRLIVGTGKYKSGHETARAIVMEGGGDYLLTVKGNQPTVETNIQKLVSASEADFPPSSPDAHSMPHRRKK